MDFRGALRSMITMTLAASCTAGAYAAASLHVCVERIAGWEVDFTDAFEHGPIRLPAGTVFDFAEPAFGPASDPRDESHKLKDGGWSGISKEESDHRGKLLVGDLDADKRHKPGIITLSEVKLTKGQPCADVLVAAVDAPDWNWTVSPVFGASDTYFQTFGVVRGSSFLTNWDDESDPLSFAATRGEINGILRGTTERTIRLPAGR